MLGLQPMVSSSHGLFLPVFDHCMCRTLCKTQFQAGEELVLGAGWKTLSEPLGWDRVSVRGDGVGCCCGLR